MEEPVSGRHCARNGLQAAVAPQNGESQGKKALEGVDGIGGPGKCQKQAPIKGRLQRACS